MDAADFATASAPLRRNQCYDYRKMEPTRLRGVLARVWETMVVEAYFFDDAVEGDPRRAVAERWLDRLWDVHACDPGRHYHTIVRLWEMTMYLMLLMKMKDLSCGTEGTSGTTTGTSLLTEQQRSAICLAIFFHDAAHDPRSSRNEEDSALLFEAFAKESGLRVTHPEVTERVVQFILATKKRHEALRDATCPLDRAAFLDLDLSVLGKDPEAYQSSAALIRREHRHVPRDLYRAQRAQVLTHLLEQPCLYGTPLLRQAWERQARDNVQAEIAALRVGIIYGESSVEIDADDDATQAADPRLSPATG